MPLHFSHVEFQERLDKTTESLRLKGLDALLIFRQESMYWLTGYDTFGYVFFQCLVVTSDGRVVLLTRMPDLRQAQNTSNIKDIRIWTDKHGSNPADDLRYILVELGLEKTKLGVEYEAYGLTGRNTLKLHHALKDFAHLEDQSELISTHRLVKSESEIAYTRQAAQLADKALETAWDMTQPGADEGHILAAMQAEIFKGGGDYPGNEFIIGSGDDALLCRYFSGRKILQQNDQLTLEWAGAYRHYHAAQMRTIPIGTVSQEHIDMHRVCEEALFACAETLKPGNMAGDVFDTHAKIMDQNGYTHARMNACGYSMGTTFSPNWMDWPMLYHGNPVLLEPGQIFFMHMILMDSDKSKAMNLGETYLVTKNGSERLGQLSTELITR